MVSVVDDDLSVRQSVRMLLEAEEFDAEIFSSAEEFLSVGHLTESVCLVLDIRLPGMSGIELQTLLRAGGNNIGVIFITAHPDEQTRQLALRAGAIRYFSKPFNGTDLLNAVRTGQ
jgi:FixJ family two-component response regulator